MFSKLGDVVEVEVENRMIWVQVCRSKVELDMCPDDNRKGRGLPPHMVSFNFSTSCGCLYQFYYHSNSGISTNRFIILISQVSHLFDNPQRVSWQNNSLTTLVEAVSSDVLELSVPPQGIRQQMSPFWPIATMCEFRILSCDFTTGRKSHICTMWESTFDDSFSCGFTTGCEFLTFTTPFLLQLASMCDLTICWGHTGKAAKPENPESPVFVPSP